MANSSARASKKIKHEVKEDIGDKVERASRHPWMQNLTRYGYFARGVLFAVIGFISLQVALGAGGRPTDQTGALTAIAGQPFGRALLLVVVVGLAAFSLWGFIRAIFDPMDRGDDAGGIIERIGFVISGFSYGALVIPGVRLIMDANSQPKSQTQTTQDLTAQLMAHPFGQWIITAVGLAVIGWSLGQLYLAYTCKFKHDFRSRKMTALEKQWAERIGQIGIGARGLVFALIGSFLIQSALQHNPSQAKGLDEALLSLARWPGGPWILAFAALGLLVFGIYSMLSARWMNVT